jgi:hypothetical protein
MSDRADHHRAVVNAWAEQSVSGLTPARMLQQFEEAFAAVWQRADLTLGDVTLMAILDRVLYDAATQFPELASVRVGSAGLQCDELRAQADSLDPVRLLEALKFVLVEFLTVLGKLVGEILTPGLHAELSKIARAQRERPGASGEETRA